MVASACLSESRSSLARSELLAIERTFDRQQSKLGRRATVGRETAHVSVGSQYAVTGNHNGKWVLPQRSPNGTCGAG